MKQTIILIAILIMLVALTIICYILEKRKKPWIKKEIKDRTTVYKTTKHFESFSREMNKRYKQQNNEWKNENKKLHCDTCGDEHKDATRMHQLLSKVRYHIQHGKPIRNDYAFVKEINDLIEEIEPKTTEMIE